MKKKFKKSSPPSWNEVSEHRRKVLRRLHADPFVKTVLSSCLRVGKEKEIDLRGNFVAAGLREAITHILHQLASDQDVRSCVWFKQAKDTKTVTRRQRADYIVKAGLPNDFVANTLGLDLKAFSDPLLEVFEDLNKATHVRPETILSKGRPIRRMFSNALKGIEALLDAAEESRGAVSSAVEDAMPEAVFDRFIANAIDELDELSTHTRVDGHSIESITVKSIDAIEIVYEVEGTVDVELQYGSNSDVANDIGSRSDDSYPYIATVRCKAAKPLDLAGAEIDIGVDTDSFYQ